MEIACAFIWTRAAGKPYCSSTSGGCWVRRRSICTPLRQYLVVLSSSSVRGKWDLTSADRPGCIRLVGDATPPG
jgi:hypothetical protein